MPGYRLYANDEDAIVVELHFYAKMRIAVDAALAHFMDGHLARHEE
jgi:hypothetical protein